MSEENYAENLAEECKRLGIAKVFLMACPDYYQDISGNDGVAEAVRKHPDIFVGFAYFALGADKPDKIEEYRERGFTGLKMINPPASYDEREYFPVYGRAEELGVPILFHLGIVARDERNKDRDINCNRMRPIHLDAIARAFPGLTVFGAHFGNPWYEEAAMTARWNPNVYFDLSGSTLKKKKPQFLGDLLWWTPTTRYRDPLKRYAWEKIVFGSDVPWNEIDDVMNDYRKTMDALGITPDLQEKVMGGTAAKLMGF